MNNQCFISEKEQGVGVYSDGVCGGGREMFIGSLDACVDQDDALLLAAACHSNGEHCM